MKKYAEIGKSEFELKDSYFDGYEYKGFKVRTKLLIDGCKEYKPLKISNAADVYHTFKNLRESDRERLYSIHLNGGSDVIGVDMVSQGSINSSPVHPREVFKPALLSSASNIILVHSHPSGNSFPSSEDRRITQRLKKAGELLGIKVLDHVIIGYDDYYSFSEDSAWE